VVKLPTFLWLYWFLPTKVAISLAFGFECGCRDSFPTSRTKKVSKFLILIGKLTELQFSTKNCKMSKKVI
jgi:hypothetical protein